MRDERNDRRNGGREKLSWREIDSRRDKSRRDQEPAHKSSAAALAGQKSYRAALERAFEQGKLGELARTLVRGADEPRPSTPSPILPAPPPAPPPGPANITANMESKPEAPQETTAAIPPAPPAPKDPERENRQKMLAKIRQAESRDLISRAVDAFLTRYAKLPDDYEVLTKALSHRDDERVRSSLDQLVTMIEREKPRRARTLAAQLRYLEDTHADPEIRRYSAEVRSRL
ncbi:MAG: hypothetical protein HY698_14400 [Deltaproteobacteria bacterium]|nr:hypothetical protein [Deltaproteobacteria bacterium]